MDNTKRLYLSQTDKMIMGVCGGLGEYFGIDPLIFRALFVLFSFGGGAGILVYIILAIVTPKGPSDHEHAPYPNHEQAKEKINEFAHQVKQGAQNVAEQMKNRRSGRRSAVGLIIVIFGLLLLLNNLFPQTWFNWNIFWPAVIILAGVVIAAKRN